MPRRSRIHQDEIYDYGVWVLSFNPVEGHWYVYNMLSYKDIEIEVHNKLAGVRLVNSLAEYAK